MFLHPHNIPFLFGRMSSKHLEVAALEYTSVKVPYEVLNKKFRHAQKIIDREISQLNIQIVNISKLGSKEEQAQELDVFKEKLASFRKKVCRISGYIYHLYVITLLGNTIFPVTIKPAESTLMGHDLLSALLSNIKTNIFE